VLEVRYRRHAVGMHLAAFVERDIFADDETLVGEMISGFVGQIGFAFIVKPPAAARLAHEVTVLVLLVRTLPHDSACPCLQSIPMVPMTQFGSGSFCIHSVRHFWKQLRCAGSATQLRVSAGREANLFSLCNSSCVNPDQNHPRFQV